jgi:hypothetical protein
MSKIKDSDIIKKFINLLENNLLFKGSPKGGGPASPYKAPTTRPIYGKSNYDLADYMAEEDEDEEDEESGRAKVKVAKYFSNSEPEDHDR